MLFEIFAHLHERFVRSRHFLRQIGDRMRRAHARDDIFALRVDQVFAVKDFFAGGRIARERDTGRARFAHIAKHHRLNVDRRAPIARDAVFPPINNRAIIHP